MKKIVFIVLALVILLGKTVFALETRFMNIRSKILIESQEIKSLLADTKDIILVNSMWDSCAMAISQLDAYFSLVGIFNTIKKEDASDAALDFLVKWLNGMKNTNNVNINSLNSVTQKLQAQTQLRLEKLKGYFAELNQQIDAELKKLSAFKETLTKKQPPLPAK